MAKGKGTPRGLELWLLVGILLLATVLRVGWPTLTEFKFSEARLEALALEMTREGRIPLVGVPSSAGFDHSPISVYLYVPAFLFTTNPIPATIYGGLVGVAAVALCWWLARRWPGGGRWAALTGTLLFAVSPWAVAFSRKIWQVAFVPLLTLSFVGLIISALIEGSGAVPSKQRQWRLGWAIVLYALLVQVHPSAISLVPALLLWLIVFWRRVRIVPLLIGGALGLLSALPFLVHQIQNGWPALMSLDSLQGTTWDLSAVHLAWEAISGRSIHALAGDSYPLLTTVPSLDRFFNLLGGLTIGATVMLLWRSVRRWRSTQLADRQAARVDAVLLSWLLIPIAFNLRHSLDLYLHFFALVAPAAYLIIGRAAGLVLDTAQAGGSKWYRPILVGAATVLGLLAMGQVIAVVLMGRFVATHDTPGGFGTPLAFYLDIAKDTIEAAYDAEAAEVLVVGQGDSIVVDPTAAIFDVLLRDKITYRFVDGKSAAVFPAHRSVALLSPEPGAAAGWYDAWPMLELGSGYRLAALDVSGSQDLQRSEVSLKPVTGPRAFQNGVEFQQYGWEHNQEGTGRFWLQWQVLWLDEDNTHFFVQVLDRGMVPVQQQDSVGFPTESRQKGDRIVTKFDITSSGVISNPPHWGRGGLYFYPEVVNVPVIDDAGNPIGDGVVMGPLNEEP